MDITDEMYNLAKSIVERYEDTKQTPHILTLEGKREFIKSMPRNPNLKYNVDGEVSKDHMSRIPNFVDYNTTREVIRRAKINGHTSILWLTSVAVAEELEKDMFQVNGSRISW